MVVKIYMSGISGNKEVKKKQQRVQMILDSKSIVYEAIDITEPGREKDKETMQTKSKIREVLGKHPLPPQLFNDEEYCGDYEDFDLANEVDELEAFLHLPIPSKLISCDNETLTTKVNGSREGVDDVTNGSSAEKDKTSADNDATPEENIVNSTPDETQENPQTSQNEIEDEEVKENEIDSEVTGEKTEDDRLDEDVKVEDEINDDEQITQQENDVPNAEIKVEEIMSENKKVDEAEEIQIDKEGLMPAFDNSVSENDNNNLLTASSSDSVLKSKKAESEPIVAPHDIVPEVEQEINDNITPVKKEKSALKDQPESSLIISKSPAESQVRQIFELEKTEPLEWLDNIPSSNSKSSEQELIPKNTNLESEKHVSLINEHLNTAAILPSPTKERKEVDAEDLETAQLKDTSAQEPKSAAILDDYSKEHDALKEVEKQVNVEETTNQTASLVVKTQETITKKEKELSSSEITKNREESSNIRDVPDTSVSTSQKQEIKNQEKTEDNLLSEEILPSHKENNPDLIQILEEPETKPAIVSDVASSSLKISKELSVDSQNIAKKDPKAVIVPSELSDDNLLIMPSHEENLTNRLEKVVDNMKLEIVKQIEDYEEDPKWEGTRLCRRDTLKRIKRPSLSLLRPSSIKEECVIDGDGKEMASSTDSKNDEESTQTSSAEQNVAKDISLNECTVELNTAGKHIDQSLIGSNLDFGEGIKNSTASGSNEPSNSSTSNVGLSNLRGNIQNDFESSSTDAGSAATSTSSSSQNPHSDSQNSISNSSTSNVSSSNVEGCNQNTFQSSSTDTANNAAEEQNSGRAGASSQNPPSDSQNGISNSSTSNVSSSNVEGCNRNTFQSSSTDTGNNAAEEQNSGKAGASSQNSPSDSQNNNLSNASARDSRNMNSASGGNNVAQGTPLSGSLNIQLEDESGRITNLDEIQLPENTDANTTKDVPEHHTGLPTKELLKHNYVSPFSVDKIAYSPQLVSKIKSDSLKKDEKGVVLPNWDRRPSEVDLVKQVRHLLDERDTEIAISRARMRAGRSPLRDPHQHFVVEMKKMINKYKDDEEEVEWPVVPPPREPSPPPPEPPVNEFLEEVLRALNAPYIPKPKPPPEEPQENVFLKQVIVLLDSEQMTGDSQATFFQKERGPVEDPEFVHKVRIMLNERESTLGLKQMEHPEKRDHTEFLSEVLVLLDEEPLEVPKPKPIEPSVVNIEPEAVKGEIIVEEEVPTPSPIVEEKPKTPVKQAKAKLVKTLEDELPKKKEIQIAKIFIRDNIFPVTAQVSTDNFQIFVSALGSQNIELKKEDLDALTITVIEDNGYKSDVAKIVVSPNL